MASISDSYGLNLASYHADRNAMMEYLRRATYRLSPVRLRSYDHDYEFEATYKTR